MIEEAIFQPRPEVKGFLLLSSIDQTKADDKTNEGTTQTMALTSARWKIRERTRDSDKAMLGCKPRKSV